MKKTELKKMFKEVIDTYKIKADADYDMKVEVLYIIDNICNEVFCEVRLLKDDQEMEELTNEYDFDQSKFKTYGFAWEVVEYFQSIKLNAEFRKVIAN